jgi:hypothetical protein
MKTLLKEGAGLVAVSSSSSRPVGVVAMGEEGVGGGGIGGTGKEAGGVVSLIIARLQPTLFGSRGFNDYTRIFIGFIFDQLNFAAGGNDLTTILLNLKVIK